MSELVTIKEFAGMKGVNPSTIWRWIRNGEELPGGRVYKPKDGRTWIEVDKREAKEARRA